MNNKIIATIVVLATLAAVTIAFVSSQTKNNPATNSLYIPNSNSSTLSISPKLNISTSFYPVQFLVANIIGNTGQVQSITPKNISPHDYEITPQDLLKVGQSDLFVYLGGDIDGFGDKVADSLKLQNKPSFAINKSIPIQLIQTQQAIQKTFDPHTWLSPKNMIAANQLLTGKLSEQYPNQKSVFEFNASILDTKLKTLDQAYATKLSNCKLDFVVTSHDAFGYLARSYNFQIQAVAGIDPNDQISIQEFNNIVDKVKSSGVQYVFAGDDEGDKSIQNLADKTGTKVLELATMETIDQDQDYFSQMQANLDNLVTARDCK